MKTVRLLAILLVLLFLTLPVSAADDIDPLFDIFEVALDDFYPEITEHTVQAKLNFTAARLTTAQYGVGEPSEYGYYSDYEVPAAEFEEKAAQYFDLTVDEMRALNTPPKENNDVYYSRKRGVYVFKGGGMCDDHVHILGYTPLGDELYDVYFYPVLYAGYTYYGGLQKMKVRYDGERVRMWTIERDLLYTDYPTVLSPKTTVTEPTAATTTTTRIITTTTSQTTAATTAIQTTTTTGESPSTTTVAAEQPAQEFVLPVILAGGGAALLILVVLLIHRKRR